MISHHLGRVGLGSVDFLTVGLGSNKFQTFGLGSDDFSKFGLGWVDSNPIHLTRRRSATKRTTAAATATATARGKFPPQRPRNFAVGPRSGATRARRLPSGSSPSRSVALASL